MAHLTKSDDTGDCHRPNEHPRPECLSLAYLALSEPITVLPGQKVVVAPPGTPMQPLECAATRHRYSASLKTRANIWQSARLEGILASCGRRSADRRIHKAQETDERA